MLVTTLIYGITFVISLIFCRVYEKTSQKNSTFKNILLVIGVLLPPIVLATFRYDVGTDYKAYIINYLDINWTYGREISIIWDFYSKEPLYVIINMLGYTLSPTKNGIGLFLISSCIYMVFILEAIDYFRKKFSMTLSLFIFYLTYYFIFFNALRQMIAASIILFAFRYILERKPKKYIFWVIIAGMFHKTAYIMCFLYLLNFTIDSKKTNKIFYTLIIISPLFMVVIQRIISYLANKIGIYANYVNMDVDFDLKFLLYTLPVLIFIALKRDKILEIDKKYEILIKTIFLQIPFQFLGCYIYIADRLAIYFSIFQIILVPMILRTNMSAKEKMVLENNVVLAKLSDKNKKVISKGMMKIDKMLNNEKFIKTIIVFWYILYFLVMYTILNGQGIYPYKSILNF